MTGTFTDPLLINEAGSGFHIAKVQSTPAHFWIGVLNGVARVCKMADIQLGATQDVVLGTTVATNAILSSKGARVGLVTTRGYRTSSNMPDPSCPMVSAPGLNSTDPASCTVGVGDGSA